MIICRTITLLKNKLTYTVLFKKDINNTNNLKIIFDISIITQVIVEILALSLVENGVIFCYNHLLSCDYSGRTIFQNGRLASFCQCDVRGN